jgi:DNA-directed RNA polymerase subunit RPC12/RpoP
VFGSLLALVSPLDINRFWLILIAAFAGFRCWNGFQQARLLSQLEQVPRRRNAACPSCGAHPFLGACWQCDHCRAVFDMFAEQAQCPECGKQFGTTTCLECGRQHPIWAWYDEQGQPARADADEY